MVLMQGLWGRRAVSVAVRLLRGVVGRLGRVEEGLAAVMVHQEV
jgi:hypothetical protein